jgi:hypothetical protein
MIDKKGMWVCKEKLQKGGTNKKKNERKEIIIKKISYL